MKTALLSTIASLLMLTSGTAGAAVRIPSTRGVQLVDNTSDYRTTMAYLLLDASGHPSLYPAVNPQDRGPFAKQLVDCTKANLQQSLSLIESRPYEYSATMMGFTPRGWQRFEVVMCFADDRPTCCRVIGPGINDSHWYKIVHLPMTIGGLPVEVFCPEGPRDCSHCGLKLAPLDPRYLRSSKPTPEVRLPLFETKKN